MLSAQEHTEQGHMSTQQEGGWPRAGRGCSPATDPAGTLWRLDLGLPGFQNCEKCVPAFYTTQRRCSVRAASAGHDTPCSRPGSRGLYCSPQTGLFQKSILIPTVSWPRLENCSRYQAHADLRRSLNAEVCKPFGNARVKKRQLENNVSP